MCSNIGFSVAVKGLARTWISACTSRERLSWWAIWVFAGIVFSSGTAGARGIAEYSYDVQHTRAAMLYQNPPPSLPWEFQPPRVLEDRPGYWEGVRDELLLERIRSSEIRKITVNRGGSSVSLRLHLADGSSAAFKPDQVHYHSMPRKEIAAYRVNRLLGLSRVPPATHRIIPRAVLFRKINAGVWRKRRLSEEIVFRSDNTVAGEVSWWIPVLSFLPMEDWEQRKKWYSWLRADVPMDEENYEIAAQMSVMMVFDFLIDNMDRFSGRNVRANATRDYLYFMDNTLSFFPRNPRGSRVTRSGLYRTQRFSRRLYEKLRGLTEEKLRMELAKEKDPPWPLLEESELQMLMRRRVYALRYIHRTIAQYGWENTMVFP